MHNIHYSSCADNEKAKKKLEEYWNNVAMHEGYQEGSCGLPHSIRWINHTCDSYEEAEAYIKVHDNGWYDQLAVKYLSYPNLPKSKTYEVLKERSVRLRNRYNELANKIHYEGAKSAFVSCRTCESKLSSKYFGSRLNNKCPVCGADLRPESTLLLIDNALKNAKKAEKDFREEEKKLEKKAKDKAEVKWLVKIEYHT